MGSRGGEDLWQDGSLKTRWAHIPVQITRRNTGEQDRPQHPRVSLWGNKASKPLAAKCCGNWREFFGEDYSVPECTQAHIPRNQHGRAQFACGKQGKWLKAGWEPSKWHYSLLGPSSTYSATMQLCGLPCPGEYVRLHPLQCNRPAETKKKYGPNERTDQSSRKNTTKRWRDSQPMRPTVQHTGNQEAPGTLWVI